MARVKVQDIPYSLSFDGGTSNVAYTTPTSIVNMTAYTVSAWINIAGLGGGSLGRVIDNNGIVIFTQGMGATYKIIGQRTYSVTASAAYSKQLLYNKWYHMCVTWAGTGSRPVVYINGVISDSGGSDQSGTVTTVAATTTLGNRSDNIRGLKGSLSDVKVYNRSLTASEVAGEFANSSITSTASRHLFTEGAGSTAYDSSGNNNNGTITNGTWSTDTPVKLRSTASNRLAVQDMKSSLSFNGGNTVDRQVQLTTPLTIGTTADFTTGGWVYLRPKTISGNNDPHTFFLANFSFANNTGYLFQVTPSNGSVRVYIGNTLADTATGTFKYNQWNYIVYEMIGTTINIYLNNMVTPATTLAITRKADDTLLSRFGQESSGTGASVRRIDGYLSSHFAAQRVLTSTEKTALMNGTSIPSGLGVYYKLNEGSGSTAYDSSGNNNNGTITNGTWVADTPTKKRKVVGGNLVYNGDFEYAPPTNVACTGSSRWLDGTAAGSTTNNLFGWATGTLTGTASVMLDTTVSYSGSGSIKLSTSAIGSSAFAFNVSSLIASQMKYAIPILPSTSYTYSFMMKTNVVSGSAATGAQIQWKGRDASATNVSLAVSTAVTTTTDWIRYTGTFTTHANARYMTIQLGVTGNDGTGTLIMDAWFSNIVLKPTVTEVRNTA